MREPLMAARSAAVRLGRWRFPSPPGSTLTASLGSAPISAASRSHQAEPRR
jgi:hypothetical protein